MSMRSVARSFARSTLKDSWPRLATAKTALPAVAAWLGLACIQLACTPQQAPRQDFPFLESESNFYVADPVAGFLHKPNARRVLSLSERSAGAIFTLETNNLGFREDRDTATKKAPGSYRILVTGDSHTDGVVANAESFANRLELRLAAAGRQRAFEVINGGVGHYGPFQYRRFYRRHAELAPDLLVVNLFMGNDFLDTCRELEQVQGVANPRPEAYGPALAAANPKIPGGVAQGLNQVYYLTTFPPMVERSLAATAEELIALRDEARDDDVPLLVLLQPARIAVDRGEVTSERLALARQQLGIGPEALAVQETLRQGILARLQAARVPFLDLHPSFAAEPAGLFWDYDEHLSVRGHERVAAELCVRLAQDFGLPCADSGLEIFAGPGLPSADSRPEIFADGFEAGDLSGWSLTVSAAP
jgi:hypothetical protein